MQIKSAAATAAAFAFLGLASGHIILESPKPYVWKEYGPTNPIDPSGANWPCKNPGGGASGAMAVDGAPTELVAGAAHTATFSGTAVHGGGSCQFALTPGFAPARDSAFAVIHSVMGGCPAVDQVGNLEAGQTPNSFRYTVPETVQPGNYTFVWSWVNRIAASPEYYMNCAPVVVVAGNASSGSATTTIVDTTSAAAEPPVFPALFVANVGDASVGNCTTEKNTYLQVALEYPRPGANVEYADSAFSISGLMKPTCEGLSNGYPSVSVTLTAPGATYAAATSHASLSSTSAPPVAASASAVAPLSSSSNTPPKRISVTLSVPTTFSTAASSTSSSQPVVVPSDTSRASPATATATATPTPDGTCTDGHLMCAADARHMYTCTGGRWVGRTPLAPGTRCAPAGSTGVGLDIKNSRSNDGHRIGHRVV